MLAFPTVTVHGVLILCDPGRCEHCGPWDVQMPHVLHSCGFTLQRDESWSSLGKTSAHGEEVSLLIS